MRFSQEHHLDGQNGGSAKELWRTGHNPKINGASCKTPQTLFGGLSTNGSCFEIIGFSRLCRDCPSTIRLFRKSLNAQPLLQDNPSSCNEKTRHCQRFREFFLIIQVGCVGFPEAQPKGLVALCLGMPGVLWRGFFVWGNMVGGATETRETVRPGKLRRPATSGLASPRKAIAPARKALPAPTEKKPSSPRNKGGGRRISSPWGKILRIFLKKRRLCYSNQDIVVE